MKIKISGLVFQVEYTFNREERAMRKMAKININQKLCTGYDLGGGGG